MHRQQLRASKNKNSAYSAFNDDPTRIFVVVLPYQLQALKLVVLLQHVHSEFSIYLNFYLTISKFCGATLPSGGGVEVRKLTVFIYLQNKTIARRCNVPTSEPPNQTNKHASTASNLLGVWVCVRRFL